MEFPVESPSLAPVDRRRCGVAALRPHLPGTFRHVHPVAAGRKGKGLQLSHQESWSIFFGDVFFADLDI